MFVNPEIMFDQVNEGFPYIIGPSPLVIYTADDCRVEVSSASPAQLSVSRKTPGIMGSLYCLELITTISKSVCNTNDNDNLERWIDPLDLRIAKWGTPYARPLTISFDAQAAVPGDYTASFIDWSDDVYCCKKFTIPIAHDSVSVSLTFPAMTGGEWSQGGKFLIDLGSGDEFATTFTDEWACGHCWHIAGAQRLTMQPVGSYLRLTNFQADVGLIAEPFRYINVDEQLRNCQRFLWKSFPLGVAVNNAARGGNAAGCEGSRKRFLESTNPGAGILANIDFPVEMILTPGIFTFSPRFAYDSKWYRANGDMASGVPNIVQPAKNGVAIQNSGISGDPNGSCYFIHVVAVAQRGGNGVLELL